jgi:hypothetical protein
MALALRSFFLVGIYDPLIHDSWPYFHSYDGIFLSKNKRLCKYNSAIIFDSASEVRSFYSDWKHSNRYKLYPFEYKIHVDVPAHVFPDGHLNSIFKAICESESNGVKFTAYIWLTGRSDYSFSKVTLAKHRKLLLPYGIDINAKPQSLLELPPSLDDLTWYLPRPQLSIL